MVPVRLSVVTYNLWNTVRWPQRAPALRQFVERFRPDVLCLQELHAETQAFLDAVMPQHHRVHDALPGWTCESNIYWHSAFLEAVDSGAEDVGILEADRRLFWVRLRLREGERTLLVSTAHFTYQNHPDERATGHSPRLDQTRRTIAALQQLCRADEPVLFMGDLNDPVHPIRLLGEAGYQSCFAALGVLCPPTYPCYPTANVPAGINVMNQAIDWIVSNQHARAIAPRSRTVITGTWPRQTIGRSMPSTRFDAAPPSLCQGIGTRSVRKFRGTGERNAGSENDACLGCA